MGDYSPVGMIDDLHATLSPPQEQHTSTTREGQPPPPIIPPQGTPDQLPPPDQPLPPPDQPLLSIVGGFVNPQQQQPVDFRPIDVNNLSLMPPNPQSPDFRLQILTRVTEEMLFPERREAEAAQALMALQQVPPPPPPTAEQQDLVADFLS